mmetsp:Transcript_319/g.837  ORF Transcript_319/g.837 Transcript_319/m.837 type:complete len:364 (+) Transcript_319:266-1357(+)
MLCLSCCCSHHHHRAPRLHLTAPHQVAGARGAQRWPAELHDLAIGAFHRRGAHRTFVVRRLHAGLDVGAHRCLHGYADGCRAACHSAQFASPAHQLDCAVDTLRGVPAALRLSACFGARLVDDGLQPVVHGHVRPDGPAPSQRDGFARPPPRVPTGGPAPPGTRCLLQTRECVQLWGVIVGQRPLAAVGCGRLLHRLPPHGYLLRAAVPHAARGPSALPPAVHVLRAAAASMLGARACIDGGGAASGVARRGHIHLLARHPHTLPDRQLGRVASALCLSRHRILFVRRARAWRRRRRRHRWRGRGRDGGALQRSAGADRPRTRVLHPFPPRLRCHDGQVQAAPSPPPRRRRCRQRSSLSRGDV